MEDTGARSLTGRLPRFTLSQWFVLTTMTLALVVGVMFFAFLQSSRRSILDRSDRLRDAAALRTGEALSAELGVGTAALDDLARAMRFGALGTDDPAAVEARLFSELLDHPTVSDITLTHGTKLGFAPDGRALLAQGERWQVTVYRRSADPDSAIVTRRITFEDGRFVSYVRNRPRQGTLLSAPLERDQVTTDPTSHPTFETTVSQPVYGRAIWSDLSFSELDVSLAEEQRRVVVTVQQAVEDVPGHFAGVLRAGLLTQTIDSLPGLGKLDAKDPSRIFLCDPQGRLVARLDPGDRLEVVGNDLRFVSDRVAPQIAAALALPSLRDLSAGRPVRTGRIDVGGAGYLVTFRALGNSQGWVAGVVVPEDYYTRDLRALRDRFLLALFAVVAVVLVAGGLTLGRVHRALDRIVMTTARMRRFDFAASTTEAPFRDVAEVMDGVERAKTSMRALGRYVPVDLVRQLYESNREPQLGGELLEVSLMFSDIEGFTGLSESLTPDALAGALGRYFEAMTAGVRSTQGTVDKFIGDSVMAFWNAPTRLPDHARRACLAALGCLRATNELYASPAWRGLPPLFTRFGLHTARVMVGHFGAPDRLSYTALGDGVNLASRLEGLCKQYGVAVLASEATVTAAGEDLAFRLIDKVVVKGKQAAVRVYELLGARAESAQALARARPYEEALEAYFARDFARAVELLESRTDDPPSRVLAERCKVLIANPPSPEWSGAFVAANK
jgi:adenylate cyclase